MFTPIAMRCTQIDFNGIRNILLNNNILVSSIMPFSSWPYLVNNANNQINVVTNQTSAYANNYNRKVYEKWDKNIFLESCGIKIKDEFVLPKNWCLKATVENYEEFEHRRSLSGAPSGYISSNQCKETLSWGRWYEIIPEHFVEITLEQFKKYVLNNENKEVKMNRRFPYYLNPDDAQKIVDIACTNWKTKLAELWASNIVLNKQIQVTETFYKEMRSACTSEQNKLFDIIFGKDIWECPYKDGDLVWVRFTDNSPWYLQYTNGKMTTEGNLLCYCDQKTKGPALSYKIHKLAESIILPT